MGTRNFLHTKVVIVFSFIQCFLCTSYLNPTNNPTMVPPLLAPNIIYICETNQACKHGTWTISTTLKSICRLEMSQLVGTALDLNQLICIRNKVCFNIQGTWDLASKANSPYGRAGPRFVKPYRYFGEQRVQRAIL